MINIKYIYFLKTVSKNITVILGMYGKYYLFIRFTHFRKNRDDTYCIRVEGKIRVEDIRHHHQRRKT
jgi:hypothetical protein